MNITWFSKRDYFSFMGYFTFGVLLFLLQTVQLNAQAQYTPEISESLKEGWRWRSMEVLTAKGVRSMVDDLDGSMWFGLDKGVIRYDGYNWELYDEQPFLQGPIGTLTLTDDGRLFAGSEAGLLQFKDGIWKKIFPNHDTINIPVTCINETPDGNIFAGVQNGLVLVSKQGEISVFSVIARANEFREINNVSKVYILPDEVLFQRNFGRIDNVYAEDGLVWVFMSRNNDGKLLRFHISDTLDKVLHDFVITEELGGFKLPNKNEVLKASNGDLWLINGFYKSGILRLEDKKWELLKLSSMFGGDELHTDIVELSDGSIWIGGLGKLFVYKEGKWNVYSAPSLPIPSSRIILHESRDGNVWIAGMQGEVLRLSYKADKWIKYKGLNFQFQERNGKEWYISVDGDIILSEQNHWYSYGQKEGLIDAPVRLVATREGRIWAAGSHQGVAATAYLQEGKWVKQVHPALSWGIDPRSVFQDKEGSLWFGASVDRQEVLGQVSGVLQLLNPDGDSFVWKHHTNSDGIAQHNAYGIGQSADGRIWLGGTNLLKLEENLWQPLRGIEYLNEFVDIVHSKKNLWVGSRYYGLFRYDGKEWAHFTSKDGLPNNTIISIYEESPNKVWAVTDRDIACFDGEKWFAGLFPSEFRLPREGGEVLVDREGSVRVNKSLREWKRRAFPFSVVPSEAMDDFWTVKYTPGKMAPRTTINIYSEKVDPSGNTFISWTGSDYWEETPSSQLVFSYRFDNGTWSAFSHETSLLLTKLGSGRHHFEVRARDLDFNIETEPASIDLIVMPPIWKQTWFLILVASFIIVIGFYEARLVSRNRRLYKLNLSLNEANRDLENRQVKIERQTETITRQKEELEKKTASLEDKNLEIIAQRDQLKEMIDKVEDLSNVKQRFFTNISHEFRTPLTLILGSIERLLASPEDTAKGRLNQTYETIQRNSKRILRLINQLLEVRKIETGTLTMNPARGDLISFTKEIIVLFIDLANNQVIDLKFESQLIELDTIFDHDKIEKIIFNLLSNAFKNTPPGGKITVRLKKQIGYTDESGFLVSNPDHSAKSNSSYKIVFEVIDNGKGIPAEHLPHIFDRFYQIEETSKYSKFDSSGIGLSYVKDLVLTHKGLIMVMSEQGKGAAFTFEIPYSAPVVENSEVLNSIIYDPKSYLSINIRSEVENLTRMISIGSEDEILIADEVVTTRSDKLLALIVEDESELRNFLREILEGEFQVISAQNGVIGYKRALDFQPDIIISDVMMPEMDGMEMCRKLKTNIITNHIPIIILTARVSAENKFDGYLIGADAYIDKPFSSEFLRVRINNLLNANEKTREKALRDLITQPSEIETQSVENQMLKRMQELLEENVSNSEFDVESMSQYFFMSRCHFSRKIKQVTGLTPKEIIDSYRLKRAGQLLHNRITVTEVAYMVGFDHPNSFSRAFRKYYNLTPSEFAARK